MKILLLIIQLLPLTLTAQDYSGLWKGYWEAGENRVDYELFLFPGAALTGGYALTRVVIEGTENIGIKEIKAKIKKNGLEIEDAELVFSDFSKPGKRVIMAARLEPDVIGRAKVLEGRFKTRSLDFRDKSFYEGYIHLKKQEEQKSGALMTKLEEMKLFPLALNNREAADKSQPDKSTGSIEELQTKKTQEKNEYLSSSKKESDKTLKPAADVKSTASVTETAPAAFLSVRKTEVIHTYYFSGDSIEVNFYDNGAVDGDTISVVLNDRLLLAKKKLDVKPIREVIRIPQQTDSLQLTMYAENLGSLPPNTGLLVLFDGKSRNEIRFAGDLSKSSSIRLVRKK